MLSCVLCHGNITCVLCHVNITCVLCHGNITLLPTLDRFLEQPPPLTSRGVGASLRFLFKIPKNWDAWCFMPPSYLPPATFPTLLQIHWPPMSHNFVSSGMHHVRSYWKKNSVRIFCDPFCLRGYQYVTDVLMKRSQVIIYQWNINSL